MLRTEQIINAKFTPVSKGTYSADEVDAFLKTVAESYDAMIGEKNELIKKISILADKIESYRSDEEAIKLALLDAHRMAENINKSAGEKAENLVSDAENKSKIILDGANRQSAQMIDEAREKAKEIVDNARTAVASLTERAQQETDQTIASAQKKAAEIIANAENEGKNIIGSSKESYEFYSAELKKIQAATAEYKASVEKLCQGQLSLLDGIPADYVPSVIKAEEPENEIAEAAEETVVIEESAEIEEDAAIETVAEEAAEEIADNVDEEVNVIADVEEVTEVSEEAEENVVYVPEEPSADIEEADEEDDLFSFIDEISFDDVTSPDSIPSSLDDLIPAAPVVETEEAVSEDDDDVFDGFKIDLDSIGLDDAASDNDDDDDITSLFDSMFDD